MLTQNSLPCSIEAAIFHVSDHGQKICLCDWLSVTETWQMCPKCNGKTGPCEWNADIPCPLNFHGSSRHSAISTMSGSTEPTFVYRRRKLRENTLPIFFPQDLLKTERSNDCVSVISSDAHSVATKDQCVVSWAEVETDAVGTPIMPPIITQSEPHLLGLDSVQEQLVSDEPPKKSKQKVVEIESINDSYSSSKSNMELVSASMKTEVDETCECSSSSAVVLEAMGKDLSEKDICISILRSEGLLERFWPTQIRASATEVDSSDGSSSGSSSTCSRTCKICSRLETTFKLLICDNCEEAFHVSCHNPRVKQIPTNEWYCHSCLKKKHKVSKETARKSPNILCEKGRNRNTSIKGEPSPIELMLMATEPYTTGVRIGKGFQADIPDRLASTSCDVHTCGEPLALDPSEYPNLHEFNSNKPSEFSSLGNWLQCRQVLEGTGDGVDGTICGKWRRAPLFEVQTDGWECFCAIQWDPTHADCAVPQELETNEVLKQLKYVEMLRPRLNAKRQNFNRVNGDPVQDCAKDLMNSGTQTT